MDTFYFKRTKTKKEKHLQEIDLQNAASEPGVILAYLDRTVTYPPMSGPTGKSEHWVVQIFPKGILSRSELIGSDYKKFSGSLGTPLTSKEGE